MSPSARSVVTYGPVVARRDFSGVDGKDLMATGGGFPFGIRRQESSSSRGSPSLKVSKDSQRIRKPPLPLPQVQYRPPVIIHTYSPKVLHTQPDDFMSLVQKLTGSSDTRLRLKKLKPSPKKKQKKPEKVDSGLEASNPASSPEEPIRHSAGSTHRRQGSGSSTSATSNCGSPSSSEDSATFVESNSTDNNPGTHTSACGELATVVVKQSNSPRSPFDSDFEFDNNGNLSMFSHFDGPSASATMFLSQQVKTEPSPFSSSENNNNNYSSPFSSPFNNSFTDFANSKLPVVVSPKLSRSQTHPQDGILGSSFAGVDSTSAYLAPHLLAGLPDLSTAWSTMQSNYLEASGTSAHFIHQGPYLRQRQFSGGYPPAAPEGTLVALENLHAFSLT